MGSVVSASGCMMAIIGVLILMAAIGVWIEEKEYRCFAFPIGAVSAWFMGYGVLYMVCGVL